MLRQYAHPCTFMFDSSFRKLLFGRRNYEVTACSNGTAANPSPNLEERSGPSRLHELDIESDGDLVTNQTPAATMFPSLYLRPVIRTFSTLGR